MVYHDVLLADGREAVAVELTDALRKTRRVGLEQQVGALGQDQSGGVDQSKHAGLDEDAVLRDFELLHDELLQSLRHLPVDLQTNDLPAAPALQRGLIERHKVLGFLLHLNVAVAEHAEGAVTAGLEAWEQPGEKHAERRLEPDEADR